MPADLDMLHGTPGLLILGSRAWGPMPRRDLLAAAQRVPGVEHAALHTSLSFWSMWSVEPYVPGIDSVSRLRQFDLDALTPDYFAAMGTCVDPPEAPGSDQAGGSSPPLTARR